MKSLTLFYGTEVILWTLREHYITLFQSDMSSRFSFVRILGALTLPFAIPSEIT
jgi:hypothetical protein